MPTIVVNLTALATSGTPGVVTVIVSTKSSGNSLMTQPKQKQIEIDTSNLKEVACEPDPILTEGTEYHFIQKVPGYNQSFINATTIK